VKYILSSLFLVFAVACGGSGGGEKPNSPPQIGQAPQISNLSLSPATCDQIAGGKMASVGIGLNCSDPNADAATLRLTIEGHTSEVNIRSDSRLTNGYITGSANVSTVAARDVPFQVEVIDSTGNVSNPLSATFHVLPGAPVITYLNPQSVPAGGPAFTLEIAGLFFLPDSVVEWNGTSCTTTFVSSTLLRANIPAQVIENPANIKVAVRNPARTDGVVASSPFQVSNTLIRMLDLPTRDIAWDAARGVIYASTPSSAGDAGDAIAVIDPVIGTIKALVPLGVEPSKLALSDDGQYLYVGFNSAALVKRYILPSLTEDLVIPLGAAPNLGPYFPMDLQVAPGHPRTLAVTLGPRNLLSSENVRVYDDATPRPKQLGSQLSASSLQWSPDATWIYAANGLDTGFDYEILSVDADGLTLLKDLPETFASFDNAIQWESASGLIFSNSGLVLDPDTGQPRGRFHATGSMVPSPATQLAFFLEHPAREELALHSFDLSRFTPVGSQKIVLRKDANVISSGPNRLLLCGSGLLALGGNENTLYLASGPFTQGRGSSPQPLPIITAMTPQGAVVGESAFTLTVDGSGFVPESTVFWNDSPRPTTFISSSRLQASIQAADVATAGLALVSIRLSSAPNQDSALTSFPVSSLHVEAPNLPSNDLVWDPHRQVIYASIPSSAGMQGNAIATIDPVSNAILSSVFVGSEPNHLAISQDGRFLYVGLDGSSAVRRFTLPDMTSDILIPLGADPTDGPLVALDIQMAPTDPHCAAIIMGVQNASSQGRDIIVFDDGIPRPTSFSNSYYGINSIQWSADSQRLYGVDTSSSGGDLQTLSVDATGIKRSNTLSQIFPTFPSRIHFDPTSNRIYNEGGMVLDLGTGALAGTFQVRGPMTIDSSNGLAFFVSWSESTPFMTHLTSCSLSTFLNINNAKAVHFSAAGLDAMPNKLIQVGPGRLAIGGSGSSLRVLSGPFVNGQ